MVKIFLFLFFLFFSYKSFSNEVKILNEIIGNGLEVKNHSKSIVIFASTFVIDKKNEITSKMHQRYVSSKIQAENILKKYFFILTKRRKILKKERVFLEQ